MAFLTLLVLFNLLLIGIATRIVREHVLSMFWIITLTYILGFVVRPLVILYVDGGHFYDNWGLSLLERYNAMEQAILLGIIGYSAFVLGHIAKLGKSFSLSLKKYSIQQSDAGLKWIAFLLTVAGGLGYLLYLRSLGVSPLNLNMSTIVQLASGRSGNYYLQRLSEFVIFGNLLYLVTLKRLNILFFLFLFLCCFVTLSFYSRQYLFSYLLMVFVCYYHVREKKFPLMMLVPLSVLASVLLAIMVKIRAFLFEVETVSEATGRAIGYYEGYSSYFEYFSSSSILSFFDYLALLVHSLDRGLIDFEWGYSYWVLVTSMVPRIIWSDKPIVLNRYFSSQLSEVSPPAPAISVFGELYMNAHWIGVFIGMFLFGVVCRIFSESRHYSKVNIVTYALFVGSFFMILRSSFAACIEQFLGRFLPFVFFILLGNFGLSNKKRTPFLRKPSHRRQK